MRETGGPEPAPQRIDPLLFAGLAGLSVAAVLQLVDKQPEIEKALGAALLCFAVALPLLVSSFLLEVARAGKEKATRRRFFDLAGVLLALAGLALLFFHLHPLAGGLFLASALLCLVVVVRSLS
jgi:hypothetical protein